MISVDWKKHASAQSQTLADIEKAFLDQAYMQVQSKAAPIMKSPYRVGFEIVFHNDDNTRLVGIFVFRVGKDLYYAPVFFINGSIKGTDLFYRHSTKRFVPLTERWLEYLISFSEVSEGKGVPISERTNTRRQLNLRTITQPPDVMTGRKFASTDIAVEDPEEVRKLAIEAWNEIKSAAIPSLPEYSILRKFITEDGGQAAITKLANTAKLDFGFASALMAGSKPENYMPLLDEPEAPEPAAPWLELHVNILHNKSVKSASAKDREKGYVFEDRRKDAQVNEAVYEANESSIQSVTEPGIYKVLEENGDMREMVGGYHHSILDHDHCVNDYPEYKRTIPFVIIDLEDKRSLETDLMHQAKSWKIMGDFVRDVKPDELGVAKPESGKMYRVYNSKSKSFSEALYVRKVTNSELGMAQVELSNSWSSTPKTFTLNSDFDGCDLRDCIFGNCCRWVEIKFEKVPNMGSGSNAVYRPDDTLKLGDAHSMHEFIFQQGFQKGAVQRIKDDEYVVRMEAHTTNSRGAVLTKLATKTALMAHCALREAAADEILTRADQDGRYLFFYEPTEKVAHNLRFPQFPEFYDQMNSDYNVQEQPPMSYSLMADKTQPYIERHRIGDKVTFDSGQAIESQTPNSLFQLSQQRGVGQMFEHGVVGALTNTFDSASMVEKYMPDLELALDRLGRILFLFYWKPEDFAQAYGSDDQIQLENKLVSNFKSYGELVIELLQKNKKHQDGSVSLA